MVTEKELELLACLEKSSRLSVDTLAKLLNIEVEEVKKMVARLENEKIIVDYVTHIDWTKVKEHTGLTAMIDVKVTPKHGVGFDAVAEQIYRYSEVKSVYLKEPLLKKPYQNILHILTLLQKKNLHY